MEVTGNKNLIRINGDRLWNRLMTMAKIGETQKGGVCRVALTDEDKRGRDLFVKWCQEANCIVVVDQMGNIFARREGARSDLPPVMICSHLDSQPTGGKFDGTLGVLAGLEVIETLNDHNIITKHPLEIVSWTNEEGARFSPAMIGSGVFTGVFDLDFGLSRVDKDGVSIGEELVRIGYAGVVPAEPKEIKAVFEIHIEQGPILEAEEKSVGVVTGVQGLRWYDLVIEGMEAHAGPTPMEHRRDPVLGALRIMQNVYRLANQHAPNGRATFGEISTEPGSRNTVPGRIRITIDLRHPDSSVLDSMDRELKMIVKDECEMLGLDGTVEEIWHMPPVAFAPECIGEIRRAVDELDLQVLDIFSGAGHDALYLSMVAPTGMIFIPCEGGLSHNEAENIKLDDLISGSNVLLNVILVSASNETEEQ
jgi:N-carbamoyl-L-amino-acid hydrolase